MINNISVPKNVINLSISYTLNPKLRNFNTDFTLGSCLFRSVKLTKNADLDKYKYSGYGTGFDSVQIFHLQMKALEKSSLFLELI